MTASIKETPLPVKAGGILAIALTAYVAWQQSFFWSAREDYSFGYLVPFFVAFILFDRWSQIKTYLTGEAAESKEQPKIRLLQSGESTAAQKILQIGAGLILMAGLFFIALGAFHRGVSGPHDRGVFSVTIGLAMFLLALAYTISEKDAQGRSYSLRSRISFTLIFLFPALIWLVSSPMLYGLEKTVQLLLLEKVTIIVFHTFDLLSIPILREGNILRLGHDNEVGVEDACSGIRSLTACIFAGSFLAAAFLDRFWKKLLMIVAALFMAFFMNIMRSLFLTYWSYKHGGGAISGDLFGNPAYVMNAQGNYKLDKFGEVIPNPDLILGSVHDVAGYAVLGVTCVGLLCLLPIFSYKLPPLPDEVEEQSEKGEPNPESEPTNDS